jgi:hypothetical protein
MSTKMFYKIEGCLPEKLRKHCEQGATDVQIEAMALEQDTFVTYMSSMYPKEYVEALVNGLHVTEVDKLPEWTDHCWDNFG